MLTRLKSILYLSAIIVLAVAVIFCLQRLREAQTREMILETALKQERNHSIRRSVEDIVAQKNAASDDEGGGLIIKSQRGFSNPLSTDPKLRHSQRQIEQLFGRPLDGLHLSPEKLAKVKSLLALETQAVYDAHELAVEQHMNHNMVVEAVSQAREPIEKELREAIDPQSYEALSEMTKEQFVFSDINSSLALDFSYAGCSLDSGQYLRLANLLFKATASAQSLGGVESSTNDDQELADASKFLNSEQIDILKQDLMAKRNPGGIH